VDQDGRRIPSAAHRTQAALVNVGVAAVTGIGIAFPIGLLLTFLQRPVTPAQFASWQGVRPIHRGGPDALSGWPLAVSLVATALWCVLVALVVSGVGRGSSGERWIDIETLDRDGEPAGRGRVFTTILLPLALYSASVFVVTPLTALLVVAALWSPALARADRRSAFSVLTGTHFRERALRRQLRHDWVDRRDRRAGNPEQSSRHDPGDDWLD
jgi:hypothetical protein